MAETRRKIRRGGILLMLCALLPVRAMAAEALVPMGCAVGIELETEGVLVAGFSKIETENGSISPAAEAGMKSGDVITSVGGRSTRTAEELLSALSARKDSGKISVEAKRGDRPLLFQIEPAVGPSGVPQLGLWLREGISGLGTVTYYDPETGHFGALGHGINDLDTGALLPFEGGCITETTVESVVRGGPGAPGELCGQPERDRKLGELERNTGSGVFGTGKLNYTGEPVPLASEEEVNLGPATILSTVSGAEPRAYSIEISRIYRQPEEHRFLLFTVTDPALLEQTGGVVQGMSGSPILQDGKLIGAVTHVLLADSTRGYGISIHDMLEASGQFGQAA